ncbi:MAG TPA: hypothetical protein PLI62_18830, partial [Spirochaetota bacterium]|nr:hypothetical protein [Spirochaetota bacterium]
GNNAYILIDAQGKRRYGTGFLFALGKEDSLIIEIAAPIIEIVNNYYYAVSLSFLRGLEAQKTQERTPLTALCLTPKQRRMTKAFYVLSKVQALPKTAHWLYFFHITGEPTSMKDKRRRNEAKGDTLCAISFLKKCGLVDVDRDPKGKNITFSKAQMLIEIEKRDVKE